MTSTSKQHVIYIEERPRDGVYAFRAMDVPSTTVDTETPTTGVLGYGRSVQIRGEGTVTLRAGWPANETIYASAESVPNILRRLADEIEEEQEDEKRGRNQQ